MLGEWRERLAVVFPLVEHLEEVLSDLSVFHRVEGLAGCSAGWFIARASRLGYYDGALRAMVLTARTPPVEKPSPAPAPPQEPPRRPSRVYVEDPANHPLFRRSERLGQYAPVIEVG